MRVFAAEGWLSPRGSRQNSAQWRLPMNKKVIPLIIFASFSLLVGAPATFARAAAASSNADNSTTKAKHATRRVTDAEFAKLAAEGGLAEVKLGQLAENKGTSQAVKEFGKRMVIDHSTADDALKTATSSDKIALPDQISAKDEVVYDRLSKLSGTAFDRAYARDMVRDHVTDVAVFRREAASGREASIKSFATQTLPTLEDHLKQARQMLSSVSSEKNSLTTMKSHS